MGIESPIHLIFIGIVALLVLGPRRLPELARRLGDGVRELREAIDAGAGRAADEPPEHACRALAPTATRDGRRAAAPRRRDGPRRQSPRAPHAAAPCPQPPGAPAMRRRRPDRPARYRRAMRLIVARCEVSYLGRLSTTLPEAVRLLMIKPDGTFMVWSDGGGSSVKPLNWMTPPTVVEEQPRGRSSCGR